MKQHVSKKIYSHADRNILKKLYHLLVTTCKRTIHKKEKKNTSSTTSRSKRESVPASLSSVTKFQEENSLFYNGGILFKKKKKNVHYEIREKIKKWCSGAYSNPKDAKYNESPNSQIKVEELHSENIISK